MSFTATILFSVSLLTKSSASSSEESHSVHMLDFNDQFLNIQEVQDEFLTTIKEDMYFPSQHALFYNNSPKPPVLTLPVSELMPPTSKEDVENATANTTPSIPSTPIPMFVQSTPIRKTPSTTNPTTSTLSLSILPHNDINAYDVIPLENSQRGILDIIFPASRVKTFKRVFEAVRKILSNTFRK